MAKLKEVTIDTLNSLKKQALNKFLKETYLYFISTNTEVTFAEWLNILTEGMRDAITLHNKNKLAK